MATESTLFTWSGIDRNGRKSSGEVMATSAALARVQLRKQGVAAKRVKKKSSAIHLFVDKRINRQTSLYSLVSWQP